MNALHDALADVRAAAEELNAECDAIAETIEQVEDAVGKAGLGLECWLPLNLCISMDGWQLGYAKIADERRWRFAVRRVEISAGEMRVVSSVRALLRGPRLIRSESATLLVRLLAEMAKEARQLTEATRKARSMAAAAAIRSSEQPLA